MHLLGTLLLLTDLAASYSTTSYKHSQLPEYNLQESSSNCTCQYFLQPIDHIRKHNGTFQHRHNLIIEFFKAGGPILLYQGDEIDDLDCIESTILCSWAKELNGIAVSLEHRYFGESTPFRAANPLTRREEFDYLTLDNIMADAVYFVSLLKQNITGADKSKAIVASGSYGGFLAIVIHQNHPESFWGAIASAPVLTGWGNNTNMTYPSIYDYNIWVNNVYRDRSAQASANIKNAFGVLEERFWTGNLSSLKEEISLCAAPRNMSDFTAFSSLIRTIIWVSAEFNYAAPRPGRSPVALPMERIVDIALTQKGTSQNLNETLWM
ncbi:hypothetical protein BDZ45DRAFT_745833 [Acephala macrosclerotiorum]|nr:hypothetical protein BDZ45DRAFT_745833 [Acephala macrosclerotiorum]